MKKSLVIMAIVVLLHMNMSVLGNSKVAKVITISSGVDFARDNAKERNKQAKEVCTMACKKHADKAVTYADTYNTFRGKLLCACIDENDNKAVKEGKAFFQPNWIPGMLETVQGEIKQLT